MTAGSTMGMSQYTPRSTAYLSHKYDDDYTVRLFAALIDGVARI